MLTDYKRSYRDRCADMYLEVFKSPEWGYDWLEREKVIRYFRDLENTPNFSGFLYLYDNSLVGCCFGIKSDYFTQCAYEIKEIFIVRGKQRSGLGGRFMNEIENILKRDGVEAITLFTSTNIGAYNFYSKHGYEENSLTTHFIKKL